MRLCLLLLGAAALPLPVPDQIHLHLTGAAGEMAADFAAALPGASVQWGPSPSALTSSAPAVTTSLGLRGWNGTLNTALMTGLAANTTYWYVLGNAANGFSAPASFVSQPAREGGLVYAIFADLGLNNNVALGALIAGTEGGLYDYVIHGGDLAYDLSVAESAVGNAFMNAIQPVASRVPYQPCAGNHEWEADGSLFTSYVARFRGVALHAGRRCGSNSSLWYSLDMGLLHAVYVNTESLILTPQQEAAQLQWLAADLAAVDRRATPWVAVIAHKVFDMDQIPGFGALAEVAMSAGAAPPDLWFAGHRHAYYRYRAVDQRLPLRVDGACASSDGSVYTRCSAPVLVVSGAAGNVELNSPTCGTTPTAYVHTCSVNYGFGTLTVRNATHAAWRWDTAVPREGSSDPFYSDAFTIVRG